MASLYKTSQNARKVLIFFLFFAILILAYDTVTSFQRNSGVVAPNQARFYVNPNNFFGDISNPEIPSISLAEGSQPTYSLRQPNFPVFPDVSYVYQVEQPTEKLGTYEGALSRALILGYPDTQLTQQDRDLIWQNTDSSKTLRFGRNTLVWSLTTNYTTNVDALRNKSISSQTTIYGRNALNLLRRLVVNSNSYNFGFRDARQVITLADIGPSGLLFQVQRPEEAEYVRVDLYRNLPLADLKPRQELPQLQPGQIEPLPFTGITYRDDPRVGIFTSVVSSNFSEYSRDMFEMDFTDFVITGQTGTYFIITPEDAWTKIQNGEASLVAIETQDTDRFSEFPVVNVRRFEADPLRTTLGFYEPRQWNGYITPIYIFQGTATLDSGRLANFTFFVNALRERVTQTN